MKVGSKIVSGPQAEVDFGNALPLKNIPQVHLFIMLNCSRAKADKSVVVQVIPCR